MFNKRGCRGWDMIWLHRDNSECDRVVLFAKNNDAHLCGLHSMVYGLQFTVIKCASAPPSPPPHQQPQTTYKPSLTTIASTLHTAYPQPSFCFSSSDSSVSVLLLLPKVHQAKAVAFAQHWGCPQFLSPQSEKRQTAI